MRRKVTDFLPLFMVLGAVVMLIAAIAPLVAVSLYSHPCADDYTYGLLAHRAWGDSHSFFEVIKQAFLQVKDSYYSWQGTHTSIMYPGVPLILLKVPSVVKVLCYFSPRVL